MNFLRLVSLSIIVLSGFASAKAIAPTSDWLVGSRWRISIDDGPKKPQQFVTVVVEDTKANSCMGGDWKRLRRVEGYYDELSEPAWMLSGNHLTVLLASDICDRYDKLEGKVEHGHFSARHSLFGIEGEDDLGSATAVRVK